MNKILVLFILAFSLFLGACTSTLTQTTELTTEPTTTSASSVDTTFTSSTTVPPTTWTVSTSFTTINTTTSLTTTNTTTSLLPTTTTLCKATNYDYDINALNYELVWFDEFNSLTATQPSIIKWKYQTGGGGWGNDELQYYTDPSINSNHTNAQVGNGFLTITAKKETIGSNLYTSARMNSNASWLYGRIDVRAKLPQGAGTWPAIWMMPQHSAYGSWPNSGEIDIMEHVGTNMNRVHFSIHSQAYNHKIGTQKTYVMTVPNVSTEFHLYSVEWLPDQIRFFVDNVLYWTYRPTNYVSCPTQEQWPFDRPFYLLLNVAIGGWGGTPYANFVQETMTIDYVRVYQSPVITAIS
jgi:beta-glucanase (GH16 family)